MKITTVKLTLAIAALVATFIAPSASAVTFFKCDSGYTFALNSSESGAHCKKKSSDQVKSISCPQISFMGKTIGTFPYAKSGKDICRGTVTIAGNKNTTDRAPSACPAGYVYMKNYSGRTDKCVKSGKWNYKAPTKAFNSN